ncbi:unnamed protein product [Effrenium voratum]|nr:unnamed protein product [Effrenium voratum]
MQEMSEEQVQPSLVTYTSAIHACTKAGKLDDATAFLKKMSETRMAPDSIAYGSLMDSYAKAGDPEKTIEILEQIKVSDTPVTVREHNSVLEAMIKAGKVNDAVRWLMDMARDASAGRNSCSPDIISFIMVMKALAANGRGSSVASLMQAMQESGITPTPALDEAVMRGFLSAKKAKDAYLWLQDAKAEGVPPEPQFVHCAMDVCLQSGNHWEARGTPQAEIREKWPTPWFILK